MHLARTNGLHKFSRILTNYRCFCDASKPPRTIPIEHPFNRTVRVLKDDAKKIANFILPPKKEVVKPDNELEICDFVASDNKKTEFQSHCDVLIIGGGGVGSSIAYWLKKRAFSGLNVVVLEKDCTVSLELWQLQIFYISIIIVVRKVFDNIIGWWPEATVFPGRKHPNELVCG